MGYKYFICFSIILDQDGAFATDLSTHMAMSLGRLEEISPIQFYGVIDAREFEQGLPSKNK